MAVTFEIHSQGENQKLRLKAEKEQAEVSETDMQKFMNETGIKIYVASARSGANVESSFITITSSLIDK